MLNFIKKLIIKIEKLNEEDILILEEYLLEKFPEYNLEYNEDEKIFSLFKNDFLNKEDITYQDFLEIGKFVKNYIVWLKILNKENANSIFSLKKITYEDKICQNKDLDSLIFKVPKDDPKIKDVLNQLNKVKK